MQPQPATVHDCMQPQPTVRLPPVGSGWVPVFFPVAQLDLEALISVAAAGLAASRLTQLQLELAKTQILEQPKPIAGDSRLQSTIVDCKPQPSYAATSV